MTTTKLDLKRELKELYGATTSPALIEVPRLQFLMVNGAGEPGGEDFQEAIGAAYTVAYTVKFALKARGEDSVVMPLETLWRAPGGGRLDLADPADWEWTVMILQSESVTDDDVAAAVAVGGKKRPSPALSRIRLERFEEGMSGQILHVGPYDVEEKTIAKLVAFLEESGYEPHGAHHEIYLSDPRRSAPDRLRTIIRLPARAI
jgi:hypothetical protein